MQGEKKIDIQDDDKFTTLFDNRILYQIRGDRERDIDDSMVGDWIPDNRLDGEIDVPMSVAKRILRGWGYKITEASPEDSLPVVTLRYGLQRTASDGAVGFVFETLAQAEQALEMLHRGRDDRPKLYRIVKLA